MKAKPWKIIDEKLYQYKGFRTSRLSAYRYMRDLRWQQNLNTKLFQNPETVKYEIYVAPRYN